LFVSSYPKLFPILLMIWGSKEGDIPDEGSSTADSPAASFLEMSMTALSSSVLPRTTSEIQATHTSSLSGSVPSAIAYASTTTGTSTFMAWLAQSGLSFVSLGAISTYLVLLNNIESLYILLNCGYLRAVAIAVLGQLARLAVEQGMLSLFGIR
jgi:lipid intermediate transporter